MKNKFQLLNGIALVATIAINYLSNTGIFNGETMASISAKYQNLFTPAGYAFSIWGLIYIGLLGFVIYSGVLTKSAIAKEKLVLNIGWWFVISCIANSLWVMAWLYDYTFLSIPLMVVIFVSLFKIIHYTRSDFKSLNVRTTLLVRIPFQMYAGWISVALIANVAAYLKKIEWDSFGFSETTWTIVMIVIAALIHLYMIWKQKMPAFALVAVWALIAIAVTNQHNNHTVFVSALSVAVFIFINIVFQICKKKSV